MTEAQFALFWSLYPLKKSKARSRTLFLKLEPMMLPLILSRAKDYAKECQGKDPKYIKHASTWIKGECWNDEDIVVSFKDKTFRQLREEMLRIGYVAFKNKYREEAGYVKIGDIIAPKIDLITANLLINE